MDDRQHHSPGSDGNALVEENGNSIKGFKFSASVIQHPVQARMSALSNTTSRRKLEPPLVIKVNLMWNGSQVKLDTKTWSSRQIYQMATKFVCNIVLMDEEGTGIQSYCKAVEGNATFQDQYFDVLIGETSNTALYLEDFDEECLLFVFPDLSVRLKGDYKLKCLVSDLERFGFLMA